MKFSFIIPTRNEGKFIGGLLRSIRKQTLHNYEILVADTNSTDKTRAISRKYRARVIDEPAKGPGAARNTGARHAKGRILIFADADVRFERDFLEKLTEVFKKKNVGGCIFRIRTYDAKKTLHKLMYDYTNVMSSLMNKVGFAFTSGSCFVYRRSVFNKAGKFDAKMLTNEDHDLAKRASKVSRFIIADSITIGTSSRRLQKVGLLKITKIYIKSTFIYLFNGSYLRDYW